MCVESRDKKKVNFYFSVTEKNQRIVWSSQLEVIVTLWRFIYCYEFLL